MNRENVNQLLCGYFNQDWMEEASSPTEVIDNFARTSGLSRYDLQLLADDLRELAEKHEGRDDDWLLSDLRCDFDPSGGGQTAAEWLRELAQQLVAKKELARF